MSSIATMGTSVNTRLLSDGIQEQRACHERAQHGERTRRAQTEGRQRTRSRNPADHDAPQCRLHQQAADADLHVESRGELPVRQRVPTQQAVRPARSQQYADQ